MVFNRQVGLLLPEASPHRGSATPLAGLRALDVGCGGGLLSEVRSKISSCYCGDVTLGYRLEENCIFFARGVYRSFKQLQVHSSDGSIRLNCL